MILSVENRTTLLIEVHRAIEDSASKTANYLFHARLNQLINYPPNGGLSVEEQTAVEYLKDNENLRSALRKILASTTADAFFDFFNILDGTSDPETEKWTEVLLVDKPADFDEDQEFLHDEFYATYWDWKEQRPNSNWSLDLSDD